MVCCGCVHLARVLAIFSNDVPAFLLMFDSSSCRGQFTHLPGALLGDLLFDSLLLASKLVTQAVQLHVIQTLILLVTLRHSSAKDLKPLILKLTNFFLPICPFP